MIYKMYATTAEPWHKTVAIQMATKKEIIKGWEEIPDEIRKQTNLYEIGEFDTETGLIHGYKKRILVKKGYIEPLEHAGNDTNEQRQPMGTAMPDRNRPGNGKTETD